MIAGGVPAGASMPFHAPISNPGRPDSATVGTSGKLDERLGLPIASTRRRPAVTCGSAEGIVTKLICTSPAISAVSCPAVPLYGTCTMLTPAISFKSSAPKCADAPVVPEA